MTSPGFLVIAARPELYTNVDTPGGAMGNSGIDVRFAREVIIPPLAESGGLPTIVDLELKARCTGRDGYVPYLLLPRSSVGKTPIEAVSGVIDGTPLHLANLVGVIDRGYQGSLRVALRNHSTAPWLCREGDAYFQLVTGDTSLATLKLVDSSHEAFLAPTLRGEGGFGSTGGSGVAGQNSVTIHTGETKMAAANQPRSDKNSFNSAGEIINSLREKMGIAMSGDHLKAVQDALDEFRENTCDMPQRTDVGPNPKRPPHTNVVLCAVKAMISIIRAIVASIPDEEATTEEATTEVVQSDSKNEPAEAELAEAGKSETEQTGVAQAEAEPAKIDYI